MGWLRIRLAKQGGGGGRESGRGRRGLSPRKRRRPLSGGGGGGEQNTSGNLGKADPTEGRRRRHQKGPSVDLEKADSEPPHPSPPRESAVQFSFSFGEIEGEGRTG